MPPAGTCPSYTSYSTSHSRACSSAEPVTFSTTSRAPLRPPARVTTPSLVGVRIERSPTPSSPPTPPTPAALDPLGSAALCSDFRRRRRMMLYPKRQIERRVIARTVVTTRKTGLVGSISKMRFSLPRPLLLLLIKPDSVDSEK